VVSAVPGIVEAIDTIALREVTFAHVHVVDTTPGTIGVGMGIVVTAIGGDMAPGLGNDRLPFGTLWPVRLIQCSGHFRHQAFQSRPQRLQRRIQIVQQVETALKQLMLGSGSHLTGNSLLLLFPVGIHVGQQRFFQRLVIGVEHRKYRRGPNGKLFDHRHGISHGMSSQHLGGSIIRIMPLRAILHPTVNLLKIYKVDGDALLVIGVAFVPIMDHRGLLMHPDDSNNSNQPDTENSNAQNPFGVGPDRSDNPEKQVTEADYDLHFPVNEQYGSGCFRRRIRLTGSAGKVRGELEDSYHGFCVTVFHEAGKVTAVEPEFPRIPFNTCDSADTPLLNLLGADISASTRDLNAQANPQANCTHLLDLTLLAINHASQGETTVQYDVEVSDEVEGVSVLQVWCNDELIHRWEASMFSLTTPETLAGNTLFKGFSVWANEQFEGEANAAAFVLQKGYFVAQARRYDVAKMAGTPATLDTTMAGACHTYSPANIQQAVREAGNVRDFSEHPEQLLKFM